MLTRRLQVLLDEERHRRLEAAAAERGVSVATVVREAIDRGLVAPTAHRAEAARRVLAAEDMQVPGIDELRSELDELRGRRG